ncbi:MAG: 16S rRNA (cytosine(967)-C(5))-methyltransferase RsmB, partial [Clostridiaceae bacterium]
MDKARKLATDIIINITKRGAYSGAELDKALLGGDLTDKDKGFVTELVYGTIKRLYTIDEIIKTYSKIKLNKMEDIVLASLRLAIYQVKFLDKVPQYAAVDEAVKIVTRANKKAAPFVNGVLRSIMREEKEIKFNDDIQRLSFEYSMPVWITEKIKSDYPTDYLNILKELISTQGVTIRVNTLKITVSEYKELLNNREIEFSSDSSENPFIHLSRTGGVRELPGFKDGYFSVQNQSAGLVSKSLENVNGTLFFDLCAAPGGKSAYLAELKKDSVNIEAFDIYKHKIRLMGENFKRLGIKNVKAELKDASILMEDRVDEADGVIADVPCSGLGIIAGKPDIKLNISKEGIREIIELQKKILSNAGSYVKKGGYLVYSTCTLNKEENEDNVSEFLKNNPE